MNQSKNIFEVFYATQNRWATKRNILLLIIIYPVFPALLLPWVGDVGGAPILDLHMFYDADKVREVLIQYSDLAIQNYILCALTVDMVYPFYYASLLSLCIAFCLKKRTQVDSKLQLMRLLPFLIMLVDWTENLLLVTLMDQWPMLDLKLANLASFATLSKWVLLSITIFFLLASLVIGLKQAKSEAMANS